MPFFQPITLNEENQSSPFYELALKLNKGIAILNDYPRFEAGLMAQKLLQSAQKLNEQVAVNTKIETEDLRTVVAGLNGLMKLEYEIRYREKLNGYLNDSDKLHKQVARAKSTKTIEEQKNIVNALHKRINEFGSYASLKANQLATVAEMLETIRAIIMEEYSRIDAKYNLNTDPLKKSLLNVLEIMRQARASIATLMLQTIAIASKNSSKYIPSNSESCLENSLNISFIGMIAPNEINCDVLDHFRKALEEDLGIKIFVDNIKKPEDNSLHSETSPNPLEEKNVVVIDNGFSRTLNYYIFYITSFGDDLQKEQLKDVYPKEKIDKIVTAYQPPKSYLQLAQEVIVNSFQGCAAFAYQYVFVPSYNLVAFNVNVLSELRQGKFDEVKRVLSTIRPSDYTEDKNIKHRDQRLQMVRQQLLDIKSKYAVLLGKYSNAKSKAEKYVTPITKEIDRLEEDWILLDETPVVEVEKSIGVLAVYMASLKELIQLETKLLALLKSASEFDELKENVAQVKAHLTSVQAQIVQCIDDDDWSMIAVKDEKEEIVDWDAFCGSLQQKINISIDEKFQREQRERLIFEKKEEFIDKKLKPLGADVKSEKVVSDKMVREVYTLTFAVNVETTIFDKLRSLHGEKKWPRLKDVQMDFIAKKFYIHESDVDTFIFATILAEIEAHDFKLHWGGEKGANGKKYSHGAFAIKALIEHALRADKPLSVTAVDQLAEAIEHIILQKTMTHQKASVMCFGRRDASTTKLYGRIGELLALTQKLTPAVKSPVDSDNYKNMNISTLNTMLRHKPITDISQQIKRYKTIS